MLNGTYKAGLDNISIASKIFNVKKGLPLNLSDRPYLADIYNGGHPRVLLLGGRQIEKSTTICATSLLNTLGYPGFKSLYIAPLQEQCESISKNQYSDMANESPLVSMCMLRPSSVMEKRFVNGSNQGFAYAQYDADRTRSKTADMLIFDEIQDMGLEIFPIILQVIQHSRYQKLFYAGTSKLVTSPTHFFWEKSTKYEWIIKCPHCGRRQSMTIGNVGLKGPICKKCGGLLTLGDILNKDTAMWVSMGDPNAEIHGYRINQMMNPDMVGNWNSFMFSFNLSMETSGEMVVQNEIFGYPYGRGSRPFDEALLRKLSAWTTEAEYKDMLLNLGKSSLPCYMGIDHGAENAYTAISVIGFPRNPKEAAFVHHEVLTQKDEESILKRIFQVADLRKPKIICPDSGMGWSINPKIRRRYPGRVIPVTYSGGQKKMLSFDRIEGRVTVNRSQMMAMTIDRIKEKRLLLPPWGFWGRNHEHYTSFSATTSGNSKTGMSLFYQLDPDKHDDLFHSGVFANVAYNLDMGVINDYDIKTWAPGVN